MHAQIVLCPGLNDGAHLERTVHELAPLHPAVATTAIVPVGLTRHRERPAAAAHPPRRRGAGPGGHRRGVAGRASCRALGTRFVFLGDEVYLQARPPAAAGRGLRGLPGRRGRHRPRPTLRGRPGAARRRGPRAARGATRVTVVSGALFGPRLAALLALARAGRARASAVPNEFFGGSVGRRRAPDRAGHPA